VHNLENTTISTHQPIDQSDFFVYDSCMTKTITLEIDAYEKLKAAKIGRESFSEVVRRAIIPGAPRRGKDLVAALSTGRRFMSEAALDQIDAADRSDSPPADPWADA